MTVQLVSQVHIFCNYSHLVMYYVNTLFSEPDDFLGVSRNVTLDSVTTITHLNIRIIDDDLCEPNENFLIWLRSLNDNCEVSDDPIRVYIIDNDGTNYHARVLCCRV